MPGATTSTTRSVAVPRSRKRPMSLAAAATKQRQRTVRLIVRRTRLADTAQRRLWPDWRHHAFITNRNDLDTVAADPVPTANTPSSNSPSATSKKAPASNTSPSGHYHTNAAWLACAALAHNLGTWTSLLAKQPPVTNRTRRTQLFALAAVLVNHSGRPTLRFPSRWRWAHQFNNTLATVRALPGPAG